MKTTMISIALAAVLLGGACSSEKTTVTDAATAEAPATATEAQLTPEQFGELGAEIEKNPDDAQRIISSHGMNEQQFEAAVRKISEDPEASRRYAEAYKKARA